MVSYNLIEKAISQLLDSCGTPVASEVQRGFAMLDIGMVSTEINPSEYSDKLLFSIDYLASSLLSKVRGLDIGIDQNAAALASWEAGEKQCKLTNEKLRRDRQRIIDPYVSSIMVMARRKIAALLGPFKLVTLLSHCKWGPGATSDLKRKEAKILNKMTRVPITVTSHCYEFAKIILEHDPHWFFALTGVLPDGPYSLMPGVLRVVDGNRVVLVNKNAKTKRTISAEPTMNGFIQQSVGRTFRGKLQRYGIDLDDQSKNQMFALNAYAYGFSTLDLKNASNTICAELIYELCPFEWASFLDRIRSKKSKLRDGTWRTLEMFSSMGNAFTFELETIIFWALSSSVLEYESVYRDLLTVYGDDVIVPKECAHRVIEVFNYCGFEINTSKSFIDGDFFESCGKHYFRGADVTPIYQKEIKASPDEIIRFANRLIRWARRCDHDTLFECILPAWQILYDGFPDHRKPVIPEESDGDDGFLLPFDLWDPLDVCPNRGYRVWNLRASSGRKRAAGAAEYAYWLRRRFNEPATERSKGYSITDKRGYVSDEPPSRYRFVKVWHMPTFE